MSGKCDVEQHITAQCTPPDGRRVGQVLDRVESNNAISQPLPENYVIQNRGLEKNWRMHQLVRIAVRIPQRTHLIY